MSIFLLVVGLLLFVGLVVLHEFGHFIMARRNGVEVEEFGIGFPPRAWSRRVKSSKGDYDFSINWLPLGGFVKLKGENDADQERGSFGAATLAGKVKIMVAGVVLNLAAAFVLLTLVALVGMPQLIDNQFSVKSDVTVTRNDLLVGYVERDSPASKAGLRLQDKLIAVGQGDDQRRPRERADFREATEAFAGERVEITYERDGVTRRTNAELLTKNQVEAAKNTDNPVGYLGVIPINFKLQRSTWSAPVVATGLIGQFTTETFKGIGTSLTSLFRGDTAKASEQVSGPVGIFVILRDGSGMGYQFILFVIAILSLTLALMNVLPIPALDGGRLFVTLLFRVLKRPLTKETEDRIHGTGFLVLMLLFVVISIVDVKRFF